MSWEPIHKQPHTTQVIPNLLDYEQERASFFWDKARRELDGLPGGAGLNIAHVAVDRHALGPGRDQIAFRWLGKENLREDFTYGRLRELQLRNPAGQGIDAISFSNTQLLEDVGKTVG